MMTGYDEMYLDDSMKNLGESMDYAVNVCGMKADEFMDLFVAGSIAESFEKGNPKYLVGQSGTELVLDVLDKANATDIATPSAPVEYECSPEYWCGWILSFYQWLSKKSFRDIHDYITCDEIISLYPTLHEASEEKAADAINLIIEGRKITTKLQNQRKKCGYSQKELAEKSGVNIRTLQQYESGAKNINKASVDTVIALSNALGCRIEDILEG